jgi:hypothetical protein
MTSHPSPTRASSTHLIKPLSLLPLSPFPLSFPFPFLAPPPHPQQQPPPPPPPSHPSQPNTKPNPPQTPPPLTRTLPRASQAGIAQHAHHFTTGVTIAVLSASRSGFTLMRSASSVTRIRPRIRTVTTWIAASRIEMFLVVCSTSKPAETRGVTWSKAAFICLE